MKLMLACAVCLVFWAGASLHSGTREPWDAAGFWPVIYPAALALSVVLGAIVQRSSWTAGALVMFAQLPVVMVCSEASALLIVGVIYVAILAIPAMVLSWLSGRVWHRYRGK